MTLNHRETASLLLIAGAVCGALILLLRTENSRRQLLAAVRSTLNPTLLFVFGAALSYVAIEVWLAARLSLWDERLAKGTLIWLPTAIGMVFGLSKVASEPGVRTR